MNLKTKISSLEFKNPISLASGTCGYGEELQNFYDLSELGAIFTKGLTKNPRPGNEGNRIIETPSGVLNSIGLENVGIDKFIDDKIPFLKKNNITFIPNVGGHSINENVELCERLSNIKGVNALELNVSCPNVKEGGIAFGQNIELLEKLIKEVRNKTNCLLFVKLSPNVTNISDFAKCAEANGADAITAINTLLGMKIDIQKKRPHFNNIFAGLSGPAVRPVALRIIYQIYQSINIPIVAIGGITNAEDVIEFMMAGASLVQIGTMNLVYPDAGKKILDELKNFLNNNNIDDINNIIGCAHSN